MSAANEKAKAIIREERSLVRRVFGSPDGQKLLELLVNNHVRSPVADFESQSRTMWRLGQSELVINFVNITESKDD